MGRRTVQKKIVITKKDGQVRVPISFQRTAMVLLASTAAMWTVVNYGDSLRELLSQLWVWLLTLVDGTPK